MIQRILAIVIKEFIQIFRDKTNWIIIFVMPCIQLILLGFAVTMDVKNLPIGILDLDHSYYSRQLIERCRNADVFRFDGLRFSYQAIESDLQRGKIRSALVIPDGFSEHIVHREPARLLIVSDAVDGNSARISVGYLSQIVKVFFETGLGPKIGTGPIQLETRMLYNNNLESRPYIVPGILAVLMMMVTMFLSAVNLIRERETGTLEQLLVTPVRGIELLIGKVLPFIALGFVLLNVGILAEGLIFGVWMRGSLLLFYGFGLIFMMTSLGLGMLISTLFSTQQQAMLTGLFLAFFFILLSGFFVPIANMPDWVQVVTYLCPLRYYMVVTRAIYLKASGLSVLWQEAVILFFYGVTVLGVASLCFKKRAQ